GECPANLSILVDYDRDILMAFKAQIQVHALCDAFDVIEVAPAEEPTLRIGLKAVGIRTQCLKRIGIRITRDTDPRDVLQFWVGIKNLEIGVQPETLARTAREEIRYNPHAAAHVDRAERLAVALRQFELFERWTNGADGDR